MNDSELLFFCGNALVILSILHFFHAVSLLYRTLNNQDTSRKGAMWPGQWNTQVPMEMPYLSSGFFHALKIQDLLLKSYLQRYPIGLLFPMSYIFQSAALETGPFLQELFKSLLLLLPKFLICYHQFKRIVF